MFPPEVGDPSSAEDKVFDKIPVRNIWLLFLYASGLAQFQGRFNAEIEASPDFKSLLARLLCHVTERRLRRNLSFGYHTRREVLRRVRGRIDILKTVTDDLFRKGEVACKFAELTINTPRNRLIRAAHSKLASQLDRELAQRCRILVHSLDRMGVGSDFPSRAEIASDQIARHQADDRLLVSLAQAVFNLTLPTEEPGVRTLLEAQREKTNLPVLFEKAVRNIFATELPREDGWRVSPKNNQHAWPRTSASPGIDNYLPIMETDIVIENIHTRRRIIVDTKFTEIIARSRGDRMRFKRDHLFQLYAYLRSQEQPNDPISLHADGILLYPSTGRNIDETAVIQGHRVRFVTVDFNRSSTDVIEQLKAIPISSTLNSASRKLDSATIEGRN